MATAANGRTHTRITGTADYDDPVFWDNKFSSGRDVGEWLNSGEPLIDAVLSHLERRPALDEPAPRALHLGPGISKLGSKLCDEFIKRGWSGSQILNVDFSSEAVRIGRDTEATKEKSQAMHWLQVNLRSWDDVSKTLPYGPFDVMLDKSTSDAIATSEPLTFPPASEASNICPTIQQLVKEQGEITLSPVEVLALHLIPLTRKGAIWATLSYSTARFDNLPYLAQYWSLVSRKPLKAPKGETSSFAHTPDVFHWLYILERI
ncbi:uncharacterized protein BP01DRAFT_385387 [Aspergillus saccharolyticus JOP 1030-1]|uniref:Methyltransferase domain-containing protein n=1 Tax=Aspergillus saccharolyticus JOP 1030-1 TaxID=1450539 RepID=A0A318Z5B6_9EURO|nr:hypothetical protein BP01DRAFT_385387 [Aspergillus saccharolyticus JOP 1030-1]PYH42505.1 hypothetical protein BP01DRAFT_385387 [Aspergillus saccharolyticus JOP 1030-1]